MLRKLTTCATRALLHAALYPIVLNYYAAFITNLTCRSSVITLNAGCSMALHDFFGTRSGQHLSREAEPAPKYCLPITPAEGSASRRLDHPGTAVAPATRHMPALQIRAKISSTSVGIASNELARGSPRKITLSSAACLNKAFFLLLPLRRRT